MSKTECLIQDVMPLQILRRERIVVEDSNGGKLPILKIGGQFQKAGVPNSNGRIYPRNVLEEAVDSIQEDLKKRSILGEFDHPADAKIHLDRVSHLITKLWMEKDGTVYGEAEVLEKTHFGSQLKALIEHKIPVAISSRGVGDMETTIYEGEEYYSVLPGFSLVTFDIVGTPSVKGSIMSVMESKQINNRKDAKKQREQEILKAIKSILK